MPMMKAEGLLAWRKKEKLSQRMAASIMDYSVKQWRRMEKGTVDVNDCLALACAAYAMGIRAYPGPQVTA